MSPGVLGAPGQLTASDGDLEFPIRATSPAWKRALYWQDGETCGDSQKPKNMQQA